MRVAEVYGRYDRAMGRRRDVASPSYETGRGRERGALTCTKAGAVVPAIGCFHALVELMD